MRHERGFTLLEVVIAFAIAALALGIMFKAAIGGMLVVNTAGRYEEAVSRAKSHLAAVGRDFPLTGSVTEGDDGGGFHWRIRTIQVATVNPVENSPTGFAQASFRKPTLYSVEVGISWTESGRTREVLLQTQRIGAPDTGGDG
jgi:general secretion pathway protein I